MFLFIIRRRKMLARRGADWTARVENLRLCDGPELCDADTLNLRVQSAWSEGRKVFSFEDGARFPLEGGAIHLEYPDAAGLWRAWLAADESTRAEWLAAVPQPLYLKPPHITKGKRASLLAD